MAKINASYDTVEKKGSCEMDGKGLGNVQQVVFSKYGDEWHCEAMMMDYDKENDVRVYHHLMSKENPKVAELQAKGDKFEDCGDFVKLKGSAPITQQIVNLISSIYEKKK